MYFLNNLNSIFFKWIKQIQYVKYQTQEQIKLHGIAMLFTKVFLKIK